MLQYLSFINFQLIITEHLTDSSLQCLPLQTLLNRHQVNLLDYHSNLLCQINKNNYTHSTVISQPSQTKASETLTPPLYFFWQIPTTLSENRWCSTFSLVRETRSPSPAWQPIQLWKTCTWKHAPVELWPLVSNILPIWSKGSSSSTHERPTKVATCVQGSSGRSTSGHMTTP